MVVPIHLNQNELSKTSSGNADERSTDMSMFSTSLCEGRIPNADGDFSCVLWMRISPKAKLLMSQKAKGIGRCSCPHPIPANKRDLWNKPKTMPATAFITIHQSCN